MIIWKSRVNGLRAFVASVVTLIVAAVYLAWRPSYGQGASYFLAYYLLWTAIYVLVMCRNGAEALNQKLATAFLLMFIVSDLWEYPVFVYGSLGLFNPGFAKWCGSWHDHIHRVYTLFAWWLLFLIGPVKPTRQLLAYTLASVAVSFILLSLPFMVGAVPRLACLFLMTWPLFQV